MQGVIVHLFIKRAIITSHMMDEETEAQGDSVTCVKFTASSFLLSLPLSFKKKKAVSGNTCKGEVHVRM